jgi:hypothetical protein
MDQYLQGRRDHIAGFEVITADEEELIQENKQSRTLCLLTLIGCLDIEGHLIID